MKIVVTGSNGLVGSAIKEYSKGIPGHTWIFITKDIADLTKKDIVDNLFIFINQPNDPVDIVIHCAGRVGGIGRNLEEPDKQFYDNIVINTNVIDACYKHKIKKLIVLSSMCIFPANEILFTENNMHKGEPFPAHRAYAYAKRMADIHIEAIKKVDPKFDACILIPSNIYGENDNYSLEHGHVIPSLIHKAYLSKIDNTPFEVWGSGIAKREFIYSRDVARVCYQLATMTDKLPDRLILSGENEKSIKEVAELIHGYLCPKQELIWLKDKPDGQLRRPSSKQLFNKIFPSFRFSSFEQTLLASCNWLEKNYTSSRCN